MLMAKIGCVCWRSVGEERCRCASEFELRVATLECEKRYRDAGFVIKVRRLGFFGYFDTDLRNLILNRVAICRDAALRLVFLNVSDGKLC